jgi:hypothetical protein
MVGGMADGTKYGAWGPATAAHGGVPSGTMAGPMVFYSDETGQQGSSGLVLTPITHAMEMNLYWDNATSTLQAGLLGSVASIPVNYTSETMLFKGPSAGCAPRPAGAGCAVHNWGVALRKYKGKDTGFPAGGWDADATLSHLGYYSDNGAYYYYYSEDRGPGPLSSFGADFRDVKKVEVSCYSVDTLLQKPKLTDQKKI